MTEGSWVGLDLHACATVDAYQHGIDGSGAATAKPAPQNACPAQFGNTDVRVSRVMP